MPNVEALLSELIELQKTSIRLQKHAITLQAEAMASLRAIASGDRDEGRHQKAAMKSVVETRKVLERLEKGRALPK
jgi:hypothetical protein